MTAEDTPEEKAARRKRRGKARRTLILTAVFVLGLGMVTLVRDEQAYRHWQPQAAQFQQDCANPAATSQNCRTVPVQITQYVNKPTLDPDDSGSDIWVSLQDKLGQTYKAKIYSVQSDNFQTSGTVTATIWRGEVEKISGGGETKETGTNPVMSAEGARTSVAFSRGALGVGIVLIAVLIWAETRIDKALRAAQSKARAAEQGNEISL